MELELRDFGDVRLFDDHEEFMKRIQPALDAALQRIAQDLDRKIMGEFFNEGKTTAQLSAATVPTPKPRGS